MTSEQQQHLRRAKVAAGLHFEAGRVPSRELVKEVTLSASVLFKAMLGVHYKCKEQRASGQLPIF